MIKEIVIEKQVVKAATIEDNPYEIGSKEHDTFNKLWMEYQDFLREQSHEPYFS
jgi:hypothetical protein